MKDKLIIGSDPFPPYQYYDEAGKVQGIDYESVRAAGEKAGYEMAFFLDNWPDVEKQLADGKIHAAFQVQKTPERERKFFFSKLLRNAVTEVISGDPAQRLDSLARVPEKGLRLGVLTGYSYGDVVDRLDSGCKVVFDSQEALLTAICGRQVDMGIFDKGVKEHLVERLGITRPHVIRELVFIRPLHIMFNDPAVRDRFDLYL